jgi:hypothetical protein
VQRWPADFDAVAATSFTNYGTHHGLAQMWLFQATHKDEASFIPEAKYPMIHEAASSRIRPTARSIRARFAARAPTRRTA